MYKMYSFYMVWMVYNKKRYDNIFSFCKTTSSLRIHDGS